MAKSKKRKKAVLKQRALVKAATAMLDKKYLYNLEKLLTLPKED